MSATRIIVASTVRFFFTHPSLPVLCSSKDIVPSELVGRGIGTRDILDTEFGVLKLVCREPLGRPSTIVLMREMTEKLC